MTVRTLAILTLSLSMALPVAAGDLLYQPRPLSEQDREQLREGILVREVRVRKGDTLSKISRRYSGKGSYFPQILLFNEIKNPNLIYAGSILRVPVGKAGSTAAAQPTAAAAEKPLPEAAAPAAAQPGQTADRQRKKMPPSADSGVTAPPRAADPTDMEQERTAAAAKANRKNGRKNSRRNGKAAPTAPAAPRTAVDPAAGQRLFEQAVKAYRQDDCISALPLFDRFLAGNAASPLAADASLYRADCYLKLSNK